MRRLLPMLLLACALAFSLAASPPPGASGPQGPSGAVAPPGGPAPTPPTLPEVPRGTFPPALRPAPPQTAKAPTGPPPAIVAEEVSFDAGKVDKGTEIQHVFTIRNTGKGELQIQAKPG